MKVVAIHGGVGNQWFQYAFARYLQQRVAQEVRLHWWPSAIVTRTPWFRMSPSKLPLLSPMKGKLYRWMGKESVVFSRGCRILFVEEDSSLPFDEQLHTDKRNVYYNGYWQHASLVKSVTSALKNELRLPSPLSAASQAIAERIGNSVNATAIHLRTAWGHKRDINDDRQIVNRQHSQHSLSSRYYARAIEHIRSIYGRVKLFIFADNIDWARSILSSIDAPEDFIYLSHLRRPNWEDLFLMRLCQHIVLSNSTFSWWGQWLLCNRRDPDSALIIMPANWTGKSGGEEISLRLKLYDRVLLMPDE